LKAKTKRILKVVIWSFILLGYILGFGIIFNLRDVLGIGYYNQDKSILVDSGEIHGGLNVKIHAHSTYDYYHDYSLTLTPFSTGDTDLEGISYLYFRFETLTGLLLLIDNNYSPPLHTYFADGEAKLYANSNLTCKGYGDVIFKVDGVNETVRIFIDVGVIITLDGDLIGYEWGNISILLNVIYLSFTVVPITFLFRNMKRLKFEKWYSPEIKERDEKFFKILGGKQKDHPNT
jgi:hypothetical protein